MKLEKMTEEEFSHWAPRSKKDYAADKMRANGYSQAEADEIAHNDFLRFLPQGLNSPGSYLYTVKDQALGTVGYLWLGLQGSAPELKAFVYDILIEAPYRGQGFGRSAMLALETEAKNLGAKEIGLHVFGFNEVAIGLYKSLGYRTTDLVMAKSL